MVKLKKSQIKELIRHTIVDLTEKTFGSKAQYDAYRKKHNLKPGSKHKVDGKTVTVRDVKKISKSAKKKADKFAAAQNAKMDAAEKMADKEKNKNISKKDKKTLGKISKMMKTANEGEVNEVDYEKVTLPAQVKRWMGKFVDSMKDANLNRLKRSAILYKVIDASGINMQQLMADIQKIKRKLK